MMWRGGCFLTISPPFPDTQPAAPRCQRCGCPARSPSHYESTARQPARRPCESSRRRSDGGLYSKSAPEMAERFPHRPEALENTLAIADQLTPVFEKKHHLPVLAIPHADDGGFPSTDATRNHRALRRVPGIGRPKPHPRRERRWGGVFGETRRRRAEGGTGRYEGSGRRWTRQKGEMDVALTERVRRTWERAGTSDARAVGLERI